MAASQAFLLVIRRSVIRTLGSLGSDGRRGSGLDEGAAARDAGLGKKEDGMGEKGEKSGALGGLFDDVFAGIGRKRRLGDLVAELGFATKEDVERVLARVQGESGGRPRRIGTVLVEEGVLSKEQLARVLSEATGHPFADAAKAAQDARPEALPEAVARNHLAMVLRITRDGKPVVVMADPGNLTALAKIRDIVGDFSPAVGAEDLIVQALDRVYDRSAEEMGRHAQMLSKEMLAQDDGPDDARSDDSPAARFVASILEKAIASRASDVHVEPYPNRLDIRMRVDGEMREMISTDRKMAGPVTRRLKLLANLDITETRRAQDDGFTFTVKGRQRKARMSVNPCAHGEHVVLRIQTASDLKRLDDLGMHGDDLESFREALACQNGMILLTGPTGSGKTTTLYSALGSLQRPGSKLITVEDPVEIPLDGVVQIPVNDKIGFSFHDALRTILRQDPDVILVGEMRDAETVTAGLRAAMTGHLVLSTLHTNDARGVPGRLADMGGDKALISETLRLVVAQRLVKRACIACAAPVPPTPQEMLWAERVLGHVPEGMPMKGTGKSESGGICPKCEGTGWRDRTAVHECLAMDAELVDALAHGSRREFDDLARKRLEGRTLGARAARLAFLGLTTVAEAQTAQGGI
jgi:MSHA biogenesis protein MshE